MKRFLLPLLLIGGALIRVTSTQAQSRYEPYSFTTFAGSASAGAIDGSGSAARLNFPSGVAVDSASNIYVADYANNTIRKITSAGVVTTLAGLTGIAGNVDGTGSAARLTAPVASRWRKP